MSNELTSEALIEQGLAALEVAEFDDAIEFFGQAAAEDSASGRAWFYLGLCYYETRQPELSIESLNRAIAADRGFADAHYLLGTVTGATGQIDEAARCYRRALDVDPHHHKAEEFLMRTEALIASREHYRTAIRLIYSDERDSDWLDRAARELLQSAAIFKDSPARSELPKLAKEVIESGDRQTIGGLVETEGPLWASAIRRAESAFGRKSWPESASNYHEAIDLSSHHAFIHHALGLIYFALGDVESGVTAWQRALDIDPGYDLSALGVLER